MKTPDSNCVDINPITGAKQYKYSIEFQHKDKLFSVDLWANDDKDVEEMLLSLKQNGIVAGQIFRDITSS